MLIEFKTKRDRNGHRRYLIINTEGKSYATQPTHMIPDGIEISCTNYRAIRDQLNEQGYTQVEYIYYNNTDLINGSRF